MTESHLDRVFGSDRADTAGCDLVVTLVHGTWARGFFPPLRDKGRWFADGSDFRKNLAVALSKHGFSFCVCPFLWSGANSIRERDKAARRLAEHIHAKQLEYPSSTQVVIAHSHGGNVALRALDKPEVTQNIFIATMATPFVEILPAKLSPKATLWILLAFQLAMVPLLLSLLNFAEKPFENTRWIWVADLVLGLMCGGLLALMYAKLFAKSTEKVDELAKLTSLSSSVRKHPMLILRAVDDEASLSLAAAAIGNRLSGFIEYSSLIILVALMILIGLIALPILFLGITTEVFQVESLGSFANQFENFLDALMNASGGFVLWGPLLGLRISGIVVVVFLLAPGVFKAWYGRELLFNSLGCQINSQSAPDSIDRQSEVHFGSESTRWGMVVTLYRADEVRRGLRHGLYGDPQCVERIAAWVSSKSCFARKVS